MPDSAMTDAEFHRHAEEIMGLLNNRDPWWHTVVAWLLLIAGLFLVAVACVCFCWGVGLVAGWIMGRLFGVS
jgi:hypothetical protein